ncbi:hypothetical protein EC988_008583, partial [Linderina pennispora]
SDNGHQRIDFDPRGVLAHDPSGPGFATRHMGHIPGFMSHDPGSSSDGGRMHAGDHDGAAGEAGFARKYTLTAGEHGDPRSAPRNTEFVQMKPSAFPMIFSSIKPFVVKGDEKHGERVASADMDKK